MTTLEVKFRRPDGTTGSEFSTAESFDEALFLFKMTYLDYTLIDVVDVPDSKQDVRKVEISINIEKPVVDIERTG